jgi:ribonuclease P protein component
MTRIGRLKRRAEFLAAAAANRKWVAPGLVLQARARDAGPESATAPAADAAMKLPELRLGFTASRKVGNAVLRNRAKRRLRAVADETLREILDGQLDGQVVTEVTDLVLIARPGTVDRDYRALKQDFRRGLTRLGVIAAASGAAP